MTLKEYIERMKEGWGFARPGRVQQIGHALEQVFADSPALEAEVSVQYKSNSWGYGPNGGTNYRWVVTGVALPQEGVLSPSIADQIFGYGRNGLPVLYNLTPAELEVLAPGAKAGFVASYERP